MKDRAPSMGPNPTLIGRTQVDALYTVLQAVVNALDSLEIPFIITGGSLLGAVRQHSILFCDDDFSKRYSPSFNTFVDTQAEHRRKYKTTILAKEEGSFTAI